MLTSLAVLLCAAAVVSGRCIPAAPSCDPGASSKSLSLCGDDSLSVYFDCEAPNAVALIFQRGHRFFEVDEVAAAALMFTAASVPVVARPVRQECFTDSTSFHLPAYTHSYVSSESMTVSAALELLDDVQRALKCPSAAVPSTDKIVLQDSHASPSLISRAPEEGFDSWDYSSANVRQVVRALKDAGYSMSSTVDCGRTRNDL